MLTKKVDGLSITCSAEEEAEILAEWEENTRPRTSEEIETVLTNKADIEVQFSEPLKAFALVVLDEINILRVAAGLPERTVQQLKNAVKTKL